MSSGLKHLVKRSRSRRFADAVLPGLLVSIVILAVILGSAEFLFRRMEPFREVIWPSQFDPAYGFTFTPHAEVRWTNGLDFWSIQKANSHGFLDREPPAASDLEETCRIVLIGDSFIEAAQLPISEKVQVQFDDIMASQGVRTHTIALGYSGTGQLNQLPLYDSFGSQFDPDVVVLVLVSNDFANNSNLLESIRNGWGPRSSPRLFAERDMKTGDMEFLPISTDWQAHLLPVAPPVDRRWSGRLHESLLKKSAFYSWLFKKIQLLHPDLASAWTDQPDHQELLAQRLAHLRTMPDIEPQFEGWNYPDDWDFDLMFVAANMPPVFEAALDATGFSLDAYVARAEDQGFDLLALKTHSMSLLANNVGIETSDRSLLASANLTKRTDALLKSRNIPLIDQAAHIQALGHELEAANFRHDGHWNTDGHKWAAEALARYFEEHPELCAAT